MTLEKHKKWHCLGKKGYTKRETAPKNTKQKNQTKKLTSKI